MWHAWHNPKPAISHPRHQGCMTASMLIPKNILVFTRASPFFIVNFLADDL
jgi:hypothetical protein